MNFVLLNSFYQIIKNQSVKVNFISTTWAPLKLIAAQNMKFSIKNFSSKCDQVRSFLKKSLMENFIFCAVTLLKHWSFHSDIQTHLNSLREKCPDSEFFLVRIQFEYSVGKYRPEKNSVFGQFSRSDCYSNFKSTPMQMWKSPYMLVFI